MIYPGNYDITVLQNSTWTETFRATNAAKPVTVDVATSVFTSTCHKLLAGDKVYIAPTTPESFLPCSLSTDIVHFVIASGLTSNTFRISTTISGSSVVLAGTASGTFSVSKPVDLNGYIVDADVKRLTDDQQLTTFSTAIIDASNGLFQLSLSPSTTESLEAGQFGYDVSLTSGGGERYYWVTGLLTVQRTYSRN